MVVDNGAAVSTTRAFKQCAKDHNPAQNDAAASVGETWYGWSG